MSNKLFCQRCNSKDIHTQNHLTPLTRRGYDSISVEPNGYLSINTTICICCNCGYIWFYVKNKNSIRKVKEYYKENLNNDSLY